MGTERTAALRPNLKRSGGSRPHERFRLDGPSRRATALATIHASAGAVADRCFATHSAVSPRAGGRLHCPDDAQTEPREAELGRRAIASVAHRTTGSPRKGAPAPTDAGDRFDDSRHPPRTLASNGLRSPGTRALSERRGLRLGARFSRVAQLGSTRLRRRADTPRAYVEPEPANLGALPRVVQSAMTCLPESS